MTEILCALETEHTAVLEGSPCGGNSMVTVGPILGLANSQPVPITWQCCQQAHPSSAFSINAAYGV